VSTAVTPPDQPAGPAAAWDRVQRGALVAAGAGLLLCAVGALIDRDQFFRAYLVAFLYGLGVTLGCQAIVMLHHMTGGAWGLVLRGLLEAATRTLPLLAVLVVPIFFGLGALYPWARPGWAEEYRMGHPQEGFDKADYLTPTFFIGRAVLYFVAWGVFAFLLNRWSWGQDRARDPELPRRFRLLSALGLVAYGATITFASIDWVMSLEPDWYSTMYGVLFGTGQVLNGFAFAIVAVILLSARPPLRDVVTPGHLRDLGNLLLAFVMLWAYMSFSQFLLIWAGNLTEEIPWYLRRAQGGWQYVAGALALFNFALPFLLLLSAGVKTRRDRLLFVAGLVMVMRFVDLLWQVRPSFYEGEMPLGWLWLDLAALAGVGGAWLAWFLWQLKKAPLLPPGEPSLAEVPHHE
jgi:hypothetical protein